ncbi:ImcF-related family protein [Escherichia coli]
MGAERSGQPRQRGGVWRSRRRAGNKIDALFDGSRVVHSPYEQDAALIRQARAFLDGHTSTERIYARCWLPWKVKRPQEFSLVRAVGADAGTVFVLTDGAPLDGACRVLLPAKATGNCSTNGCRSLSPPHQRTTLGDGPGKTRKKNYG